MLSQVYILIAAAAVMFSVIGGLSLLAYYYTLNGIKSRTVGDGQHGTARFSTKNEIKNTYKHIPFKPKEWRKGHSLPQVNQQGLILGSTGKKNEIIALVDTDDVHCLMIGASGVGKTAFFLYPNLEYACASGMSFLTTDTKGDLYRNYGAVARDHYGYHVAVIDLRNPTRSDGNNMLHLVNKYMDSYRADKKNLVAKAKAEKYAKIIAKTIINAGGENYGQNQFFYDAAEGLLTSVILLIAEYLPPTKKEDSTINDCRHIISVFKLVQDLLALSKVKGKSQFQLLMDKLPSDHKTRWFAGAALNSAEQAMMSVLSTVLSRLNSFLDSEMEQILCFDTAIDAEKFVNEKSALFIVLPEEDLTKYFMVSLMIQQLYREILAVADENDGKLKNRVVFYCDELGTLPAIDSLELIFSASRSRRLTMVPIIQSFGQLEKNYGKEGSEIIVDNCQDTIFGGFAPNSQTAEVLSKALGSRTVMSGSVNRGKNDPSQSLQMMERPLMTADELKSIPKGNFVVMKTGTHPMKTKLRLFLDWGITFDSVYTVAERAHRKVAYADKQVLEENIIRRHAACIAVDTDTGDLLEEASGTGTLHTPVTEQQADKSKRRTHVRTS
jgi:type IV secretion system protein VirD4